MDRRRLQQDIFGSSPERLIAVLQVSKALRKGEKKGSLARLLCVTLAEGNRPFLHTVKMSGGVFKKSYGWPLTDLRSIEGDIHAPSPTSTNIQPSLTLSFENSKPFYWLCQDVSARDAFVDSLVRLCHEHLGVRPHVKNIKTKRTAGFAKLKTDASESTEELDNPSEFQSSSTDTYRDLTLQEEMDLTLVLRDANVAIGDAEHFATLLRKELHELDSANTHQLLESMQKTDELIIKLTQAEAELERTDSWLARFERMLADVRDSVALVTGKHGGVQSLRNNKLALLKLLNQVIDQLSLPDELAETLREGSLELDSLDTMIDAANRLRKVMEVELDERISEIEAVQGQRALFSELQDDFLARLSPFFEMLFKRNIPSANLPSDVKRCPLTELVLPSHKKRYDQLFAYIPLINWIRDADQPQFLRLATSYSETLKKAYAGDLRSCLDGLRIRVFRRVANRASKLTFRQPADDLEESTTDFPAGSPPISEDAQPASVQESAMLMSGDTFEWIFDHILQVLVNTVYPEQCFTSTFFALTGAEGNAVEDFSMSMSSFIRLPSASGTSKQQVQTGTPSSPPGGEERLSINFKNSAVSMEEMFSWLEKDLVALMEGGGKEDQLLFLIMLHRMDDCCSRPELKGSFVTQLLGKCQIIAKRNVTAFVEDQQRAIHDARVPKKGRAVILPFVHKLAQFVQGVEDSVRGWDRRALVESMYASLITACFQSIERVANECKHPEVVKVVNYHHLYSQTSLRRVAGLASYRREAEKKYRENLQACVQRTLGHPIEKMSRFFAGVHKLLESGVKDEEIGYQLQFSKQELKRIIKDYPPKEVRKGIESMHKMLRKQLTDSESLLPVVWGSVQEDLLVQFDDYEALIKRCYPGSNLVLEFTKNDISKFCGDLM